MKNLYILAMCFLSWIAQAQVYINVPTEDEDPSAELQIDADNKGIVLSSVNLIDKNLTDPIVTIPQDGLLVYNANLTGKVDPGYYYWSETDQEWKKLGGIVEKGTIIQNINKEFLGYDPTGIGANAPNSFNFSNGGTATKQRCMKWEISNGGNGHTYCAYTASETKDFERTFNAVRNIGGYIVTIVSDAEWDFVKNNVINDASNMGGTILNNSIWLGYVKLQTPGNLMPKYRWITDETWENNWSNNASTQSHFLPNEPQAASTNANPRCTMVSSLSQNANRLWTSQVCTALTSHIIVEFNQ